jgi:hypothetical protein
MSVGCCFIINRVTHFSPASMNMDACQSKASPSAAISPSVISTFAVPYVTTFMEVGFCYPHKRNSTCTTSLHKPAAQIFFAMTSCRQHPPHLPAWIFTAKCTTAVSTFTTVVSTIILLTQTGNRCGLIDHKTYQ